MWMPQLLGDGISEVISARQWCVANADIKCLKSKQFLTVEGKIMRYDEDYLNEQFAKLLSKIDSHFCKIR